MFFEKKTGITFLKSGITSQNDQRLTFSHFVPKKGKIKDSKNMGGLRNVSRLGSTVNHFLSSHLSLANNRELV